MSELNTKTPNRNVKRRQRTRKAILEAADRVFQVKGIDSATVNDVTDEADVAYGSFYNHFKSMDDIVAAIAENTIKRAADRTGEIQSHADRVELLPCIGARVTLRTLSQDSAVRWLLDRPAIFVEEFYKIAGPFMREAESAAIVSGIMKPAGGHEAWLRTMPWILVSELKAALESGDFRAHEDIFARISLRFLGIDETMTDSLLDRSFRLCAEQGLSEIKVVKKRPPQK